MKRRIHWGLAAFLICGSLAVNSLLSSCKGNPAQESPPVQEVQTTELVRTGQSWDGAELPDYLQGHPEIVAVKYEIPAGQKLGWHGHPVINFGILVKGDLTIYSIIFTHSKQLQS